MVKRSLLIAFFLLGCKPEFEDRTSEINRLRVLAIRSEPAEAAPGTDVRLTALIADDQGGYTGLPLDWAFCTKPRPLDEPNAVSIKCFAGEAGWIEPIGNGDSVVGTLPDNGCRQFGSDIPEPKEGEPPGRPADPDPTGGYYQPARLIVSADPKPLLALGQTRLMCGLPGATREVSEKFRTDYHANQNPTLTDVEIEGGTTIAPGAKVTLRAHWPDCASQCGGAETYLQYDLASRELVTRRESMRVSWLSTSGSWDQDRTGRDENDPATFAENTWFAPTTPGKSVIFVILRDARGGVDWRAIPVEVR